ncbi:MAG: hypothetical protein H7288_00785 [Kineosporiaceae bacterium]|nr:hypothetical protein [Aeromicrobium sp.]
MHTTNYVNTLITVSPDTKAVAATDNRPYWLAWMCALVRMKTSRAASAR